MFSLPASCSFALLFQSPPRPLRELCPEGLVLLKIRFPPLSLRLRLSAPAGAEARKPACSLQLFGVFHIQNSVRLGNLLAAARTSHCQSDLIIYKKRKEKGNGM